MPTPASPAEPTWDILICSIWHRSERLNLLLAWLEMQLAPGVGVLVARDNLEMGYGEKCQHLIESSHADYICFIDDDDWVAPDYVERIMRELRKRPDYVGFRVAFTEDGILQSPVEHSLRHPEWFNTSDGFYRDIVHFNPIRRVLARRAEWEGGNGADARWAAEMRTLGCVKVEAFIPEIMYHYRHLMEDTFEAPREPMGREPIMPDYDFVTWL